MCLILSRAQQHVLRFNLNSLKDWVIRQLSMKYTDLVLCRQQELSAASRSAHAAHAEMS